MRHMLNVFTIFIHSSDKFDTLCNLHVCKIFTGAFKCAYLWLFLKSLFLICIVTIIYFWIVLNFKYESIRFHFYKRKCFVVH
jgi:hypothetical protein